jgi:hypothetical protein
MTPAEEEAAPCRRYPFSIEYVLLVSKEDLGPREESLAIKMVQTTANVDTLFSPVGSQAFEQLNQLISAAIQFPRDSSHDERRQLGNALVWV